MNNWIIFVCEDASFCPEIYAGEWCPNVDTWEAVIDELIGWQGGLEDNAKIKKRIEMSPEPFRIKTSGVSLEWEPAYNGPDGSYPAEAYLDWDSIEIIEYEETLQLD